MEAPIDTLYAHMNAWRPLPEEEKQPIRMRFVFETIDAGQFFLRAGEHQKFIGFNFKGVFRYYYIDHEGRERNKHFCLENDWVMSLTAFLEAAPALFFIQALESCEILSIPADSVHGLIAQSAYWRAYYRHLLERYYVIKEKREARFLMNDARGRYLSFLKDYPGLPARIRQHHIAAYLGISSVSLSRLRKHFNPVMIALTFVNAAGPVFCHGTAPQP